MLKETSEVEVMEELEVEHTELMTSSGSSGDLSNLSSSTTLAVSQHASPAGNDEIQVWISYESKDSEDETTQTTILRMMPNVSEKHNLRTKPDVLTSPLSPPFSFFFWWVFSQETIADVKLRVQARKGWFASQQKLTFGDLELEDAKTIELVARAAGIYDSGSCIEESNHVHLSVHLSDILNVRIKTLQGEATLAAQPESTVRELKEAVSLMNGYLPDHQHVFLNGRMLEDSRPLGQEVSVCHRSPIVHVLVRRTTKVKILPNSGNEFELSISAVETVGSLKSRIEAAEGIPAFTHRVVHNGEYLPETASLADYGVDEDSVLVLEPITQYPGQISKDMDKVSESLQNCLTMMKQAQAGFDMHMAPCLASAGTGGAYYLLGPNGNKVAVFKPEDEEPNAENNPRGRASPRGGAEFPREGLRKGTLPGEGASREFAAYILDHKGMANVPPTAMVCLKQTSNKKYASVDWNGTQGKRGSIQMFVPYECDCEEMGVSQFRKQEVHKIALLDIRLANTDRNGSNVLIKRNPGESEWSLVPIDHGYCLPGSLSDICFDWIYWPQASQAFDEDMLEYIDALDVDRDLEHLANHKITLRPECELVFRVCNILLKIGIKKGLTLYDLGCIMCRQTMQQSILEKMSNHALKKLTKGRIQGTGKLQLHELGESSGKLYLQEVSRQIQQYIDEVFE